MVDKCQLRYYGEESTDPTRDWDSGINFGGYVTGTTPPTAEQVLYDWADTQYEKFDHVKCECPPNTNCGVSFPKDGSSRSVR